MRAMVHHSLGQKLQLDYIPDPEPTANQILIAVEACGVCRTNLDVVDGELTQPKLPLIPGHEIVGRVARAGNGVTGFTTGMRELGWNSEMTNDKMPTRHRNGSCLLWVSCCFQAMLRFLIEIASGSLASMVRKMSSAVSRLMHSSTAVPACLTTACCRQRHSWRHLRSAWPIFTMRRGPNTRMEHTSLQVQFVSWFIAKTFLEARSANQQRLHRSF